ncbi:hypothetical protein PISMIDRAFT_104517, partial [Pisolithus microcarpus 441]
QNEANTLLVILFGIVVALDFLERACVRDSITAAEWVGVLRRSCILSYTS